MKGIPCQPRRRFIIEDFWQRRLPFADQGVTFAVRYGRNPPKNRRIGYARVSTYGQTLDAHLEQLRGAECLRGEGGRCAREST
jgi:hypothetical protein